MLTNLNFYCRITDRFIAVKKVTMTWQASRTITSMTIWRRWYGQQPVPLFLYQQAWRILTAMIRVSGFRGKYIIPLERFTRTKAPVTVYAGLDVPAHQSGPVDPKRHISKQGNVHIRTALYFPAIVSTQYNPQMKDFYVRLCARNTQSKMIGVTATMRKLLLLIYSLWKSGEEYDPTRDKPVCDRQ